MAFAPGKVILLGEHAVVYGHPALAGALAAGVRVTARPSAEGAGVLEVPAWRATVRPGDDSTLGRALAALLGSLSRAALPCDLVAELELPTGSGLGSSAALSVALVRAIGEATGEPPTEAVLLDAAMAAETVFHGKPSGIDAAVAARGGFGRFTRAAGLVPVRAARPVPLVVGHTGRQRDTKGRVARVAELYAERPEETRARFAAIEALVDRATAAIGAGDLGALGAAMDENARHLAALEVSCPEIERMCAVAHEAGAVGAKLTGGGGGGCVIALAPGREGAVREAWSRAGFGSFVTEVGR